MRLEEHLRESADFIQSQFYPHPLQIVAILGSGLGELAETLLLNPVKVRCQDIPRFSRSTVKGHEGKLLLGELRPGVHTAFLQGRIHYYEGHAMDKVVYPLRTLRQLGAKTLVVTNAAGGVNPQFEAGDLMLIEDHINMMGTNPLLGINTNSLGPRFPDMSEAYTPALQTLALEKAEKLGITLQRGVYCGMSGPSYETPAEIRMLRTLGADAVGMSTVPEVIAASHMGMQVLGISLISNPAAGVKPGHRLSHQEVLEAADNAKERFSKLMTAVLDVLPLSVQTPVL